MKIKRVVNEAKETVSSLGGYALIELSLLGAFGGAASAAVFGIYIGVVVVVVLMAVGALVYLHLRDRSASSGEQQD